MKWRYIVGAGAVLLLAPMFFTADLTPAELADGITPERATRGRAMIDALAVRHGRDVLAAHQRLELSLVDTWGGEMGSMSNPFAQSKQPMDVVLDTNAWTASFRLTDGPDAGTEWGMKDLARGGRPIHSVDRPGFWAFGSRRVHGARDDAQRAGPRAV